MNRSDGEYGQSAGFNVGQSPEGAERTHVVLGVTGSIAAYKAVELARILVSWGYQVRVVMTKSAQEFVRPLTFRAITGAPVLSDLWEESDSNNAIGHIELADWAHAVVVAPATADVIAKMAAGIADDALLATLLATRARVVVAPAMNVNMLTHPQTQKNISSLMVQGVQFVEPEEGELACGWHGNGRLADPWDIFHYTRRALSEQDFAGKHVLIATGPTRESIDPVRFISNRSSGKMGVALAREAFRRGARVTVVHGPVFVRTPKGVQRIPVISAEDMHKAVMGVVEGAAVVGADSETGKCSGLPLPPPDVVIMAAAVADYKAANVSQEKIKKHKTDLSLTLAATADILSELGAKRSGTSKPILVGFAVETGEIEDLLLEARRKLERKGCDLIVGNFASDAFDLDTNRVWLVDRNGRQDEVATTYKSRVANRILDRVLGL